MLISDLVLICWLMVEFSHLCLCQGYCCPPNPRFCCKGCSGRAAKVTYAQGGQPSYLAISFAGFLASAMWTKDPLQAGGLLEWMLSRNRGFKTPGLVQHQAGELFEALFSTCVQLYAAQSMSPDTSASSILQLLFFAAMSMCVTLPDATAAMVSNYTLVPSDGDSEIMTAEITNDFYSMEKGRRAVSSLVKWLPSTAVALFVPAMHRFLQRQKPTSMFNLFWATIPTLKNRWLILANSFSALQRRGDFLAALAAIAQARLGAPRGAGGVVGRNKLFRGRCFVLLYRESCKHLRTKLRNIVNQRQDLSQLVGNSSRTGESVGRILHVNAIAAGIRMTVILGDNVHGFRDGRR